jgi:iron complex outermembrane recepter protein
MLVKFIHKLFTKGILLPSLLLMSNLLSAQDCVLQLNGYVLDEETGEPVAYATVLLENENRGSNTDSLGFFQLGQLCPGSHIFQISHIGCVPHQLRMQLTKDTLVNILLAHDEALLDQVVVVSKVADKTTEQRASINQEEIEKNSSKNLANVLESLPGVSVLKNGSGISKPIIHGLYGNRVAILNNGIEQAGQQWGNDHAPEIDPFFATQLSVVKGAGAVAYGSNSLGAVVLVENNKISRDSQLSGLVLYHFETNGLGHSLNTKLEKTGRLVAWRLSGSLRMAGDGQTPDYYLTNTGKREGNISLQLERKLSKKHVAELYYSSFNANIGVLRGSHIGNLTDLEDALSREVPFFTKDHFSYNLVPPRQLVNHHLLKWESRYFLNDQQIFQFKYGGQLNNRKEFDVRRGNRDHIPSLSLQQWAHFAESNYQHSFTNNWFLKTGLQFRFVDNYNVPGTGVRPLIPNYQSLNASTFILLQKKQNRFFYEWGARYDWKYYDVSILTTTLPRITEKFQHRYHNYSGSAGAKYELANGLSANVNLGYMLRAPEVNELYSNGLHQGVSGIEEGNRELQQESAWKGIASIDWRFRKLYVQALAYQQNIQDYIYLEPQKEFRLTIRGAFPVFVYEQTDARIRGLDLLMTLQPEPNSMLTFKYAHIRGRDLSNDLTLINIPTDNLFASYSYRFKNLPRFSDNTFSVNVKYIFQNEDLLPEQDFVAAPEAYFLLGFHLGTQWRCKSSVFGLTLRVENVLNARYRDYLNRLRYFADERGREVVVGIRYEL